MDRIAAEWSSPRAAAEALGLIGLPAAVLGAEGEPLATNRLFERLQPGVASRRGERLAFADPVADALFADALARPLPGSTADPIRLIPIRARGERPPMIAHVIPLRGAASDLLAGACGVLVFTPLKPRAAPNAEVLQRLFDLTPAEARVARGIGEGRTVEAIAEAFGLSRETIRSQLKVVLGKVGLARQADLVAILAGVHVSEG